VSSSSTETLIQVTMPQMGVSVSEGTIVEWKKQVGDWVAYEETICEISTDKIDTDLPSPAAGRLAEILVEVGATVDVGTVLALLATDARPGEAHASESGDTPPTSEAAAAQGDTPAAARLTPSPEPGTATPGDAPVKPARDTRRYSPVVQRIAAEHGVDLERVEGTGRGGRVRKQDVLAFLENGHGAVSEPPMHIESPYRPDPDVPTAPGAAAAPAAGVVEGATLSRMRRSIGAHMKRSLEIAATCTTWIEVDFSGLEAARERAGITALPFVAEATIGALREFPALNATLDGEDYAQYDAVHLGIAVSLGEDGLIVPVIRDAQDLSAEGLSKRIRDVARRARSKQLVPDEVRDGTFTITNPGQYGSIMATPVINQPQVAILDLEAVVKRPVVITDAAGNDAIAIRPMCILGLSWDHRALDGALAAQFLAAIKRRIEAL
jgi:pyruvate/2-oxoglutarate dehydrogenase complex dihydrolipoamide acyltransferase (E2) component